MTISNSIACLKMDFCQRASHSQQFQWPKYLVNTMNVFPAHILDPNIPKFPLFNSMNAVWHHCFICVPHFSCNGYIHVIPTWQCARIRDHIIWQLPKLPVKYLEVQYVFQFYVSVYDPSTMQILYCWYELFQYWYYLLLGHY